MATTRLEIDGVALSVTGRWVTVASVLDGAWLPRDACDPDVCLRVLARAGRKTPDLFTFAQGLSDRAPRYPHPIEWESVAAIPLTSFDDWWRRLRRKARNDIRRAQTRGVTCARVAFDDSLVHGIVEINNAAAIRQGRRFSHFQEPFEAVKRAHATFLDRSTFIGAYLGDELIGYTKIVRVDDTASIMQFLVKPIHYDKRAANALIAQAVEQAIVAGAAFLKYHAYRDRRSSTLAEFKHRMGFDDILVPRFFVPLTAKGRVALRLGLHHQWISVVPAPLLGPFLHARRAWSRIVLAASPRQERR